MSFFHAATAAAAAAASFPSFLLAASSSAALLPLAAAAHRASLEEKAEARWLAAVCQARNSAETSPSRGGGSGAQVVAGLVSGIVI